MSRAGTIRLALALAAAGALAGCSTIDKARATQPTPRSEEGDWAVVRNQATRRAQLYDGFTHRATATATYLSPAVREARVARLAVWLGWTEEEKARRLAAERAEAERYEEFLLSFYTGDTRANDLDTASGSVWRLALQIGPGDLVTRDAKELDPDATITGVFPFVGPFDVVYRVRFPKAPGAPLADRPFTFLIASAIGKMELRFNDGTLGPDRPDGVPLPGR
jgi:hypothetical protein